MSCCAILTAFATSPILYSCSTMVLIIALYFPSKPPGGQENIKLAQNMINRCRVRRSVVRTGWRQTGITLCVGTRKWRSRSPILQRRRVAMGNAKFDRTEYCLKQIQQIVSRQNHRFRRDKARRLHSSDEWCVFWKEERNEIPSTIHLRAIFDMRGTLKIEKMAATG